MFHVAPKSMREDIEEKGLDPAKGRAIFLLNEKPDEMDEFDIWEVDYDREASLGSESIIIADQPISPENLRIAQNAYSPGMS